MVGTQIEFAWTKEAQSAETNTEHRTSKYGTELDVERMTYGQERILVFNI